MHTSTDVKQVKSSSFDKKLFWINGLTLCRIPLTMICVLKILQFYQRNTGNCYYILLLCSIVVYCTDYFDGKLARKYGVVSKLGARADLFCDAFYIMMCSISMNIVGLLPIWITFLVMYKFVEFLVISYIVRKRGYRKQQYYYDFLGRILISICYISPCILTFLYLLTPRHYGAIKTCYSIGITMLTIVSSRKKMDKF